MDKELNEKGKKLINDIVNTKVLISEIKAKRKSENLVNINKED